MGDGLQLHGDAGRQGLLKYHCRNGLGQGSQISLRTGSCGPAGEAVWGMVMVMGP